MEHENARITLYAEVITHEQVAGESFVVDVGRHYSMTAHPDGAYTVQGDGLASLTFEPMGE